MYPGNYPREAILESFDFVGKFGIVNNSLGIGIVQDVPKLFVAVPKVYVHMDNAGLKTCREALGVGITIPAVKPYFVAGVQSSILQCSR